TLNVEARALRDEARCRRVDLTTACSSPVLHPPLRIRLIGDHTAFDDCCLLDEQLEHAAPTIESARDEHKHGQRLGPVEERFELAERARGSFALALRHEQRI